VLPSSSTRSIWSSSATPAIPWRSDSAATLGLKFRSSVSGHILAIRFYKGAGNNGTHIGKIFDMSNGVGLAQTTSTSETASGWQQINFTQPAFVSANKTYIAALFSSSGYAYDGGFFTNTGVTNSTLQALRSGVDGPNGVYTYDDSTLPALSFADSNYWIDVVFVPLQ